MIGYQERDHEIVDYQMWNLEGVAHPLRGPRPAALDHGRYIACLGAAQTFGCLCESPFPQLLEVHLGRPVLNLGVGGAGPRYFADHPELMARANASALAVVQVMSGRSEDNSLFLSGGMEYLTRRADGARMGAETAYAELLRDGPPDAVRRVIEETRRNWIDSSRRLLSGLRVPTILLWFSRRSPDYVPDYSRVHRLFGEFPQLVDRGMIETIAPMADAYVEYAGQDGTPHILRSRFTGEPVAITGRQDLGSRVLPTNTYYPTPEMHMAVADLLTPLIASMLGDSGTFAASRAASHEP